MIEPSGEAQAVAPTVKFDARVNNSLVAATERRVLNHIAERLPAWCTPNGLTLFGVAGGMTVIGGYALSNLAPAWLWLANLGLVLHWLGDSLDGTLARLRRIERPRYGFYLDQTIDTLGNVLIALGVGICPAMRLDIALFVLAVYHMLSIQGYVRAIVDREFQLDVGRLGPTEMRLGIFGLNLAVMMFGARALPGLPLVLTWCDVVMLVTAAGLLMLFARQMRRHLRRLTREDPPRRPDAG